MNNKMGSVDKKISAAFRKYGHHTHKEVCNLLNMTSANVTQFKNNNQILGIKYDNYTYYLSPQFSLSNQAVPVFIQVLNTLKDISHMNKLFFLTDEVAILGGRAPMDALMKNEQLDTVLILAQEYARKA